MKKSLLLLLLCGGCSFAPLKGGWAAFRSPNLQGAIQQPQNPKDASTQNFERVTQTADGSVVTEKLQTKVGAAQKDTGREIAAKLSSFKGVVWIGVLVFLFGVASMFYPPLKLIVGSVTTSAAACAAGLALIFLPSLIVGHEVLILVFAVGAVGVWWFAHRHGSVHSELKTLKEHVIGK